MSLIFVKQSLYDLKKQFGQPAAFYRTTTTNNLETGSKVVSRTKTPIRKVIVLPESFITSKIYSLSYIAANKNFTYGALFNKNTKVFLVDKSDIPNKEILPEDYVVFKNTRYDIKNLEALEFNTGYIIIAEHVDGVATGATHDVNVLQFIRFAQRATADD